MTPNDQAVAEPKAAQPAPSNGEKPAETLPPLRSMHTENLPAILDEWKISLVVSTYQAGKLVFLRADEGKINTHFCGFPRPMGVAIEGDRLAVGGGMRIWQFHNMPAVAAKREPAGKYDACFLPRSAHMTGDIQVHEMGYGQDGLWVVNTRFSCLCTLDGLHSFVPRWTPPFITALAPQDRCHLNGLCLVRGQPCFATALGETDSPGGWRENKKNGGILIEVTTGKILLRGLSMPHSPRWYDNRLWVLESGKGGFGYVDADKLEYVPVAELPGFTRGLDFCGPLAFIGLSQVRETAVFSGIPITEQNIERRSGVWVVNIHTGETVAYLQFEEAVQELFAVQVLANRRFPDLIDDFNPLNADSFELPNEALDFVPERIRVRWPQQNTA
jgi:uncharacterized protein (TIGR03032 family)